MQTRLRRRGISGWIQLDTKLGERLAQGDDAVFLGASSQDQTARLHPLQGFRHAVFVFAAVLAAQDHGGVVILAGDFRRDLGTMRLQRAIERPQVLNRDDLSLETLQARCTCLRAQEQHAFTGFRRWQHIGSEGMEKGFDCVTAHREHPQEHVPEKRQASLRRDNVFNNNGAASRSNRNGAALKIEKRRGRDPAPR